MHELKVDILNFWEKLGILKSPGNLVTHKDLNQVNIEVNTVLSFLKEEDVLLDVGCGNGFTTSKYAEKCSKTIGIDYSAHMIESARKAYKNKNLSFEKKDILALTYEKSSFSTVVSTRCLINLTSWDEQKRAIENIHAVINPGGRFIFIEGIQQGRDNLDQLRNSVGLGAMPSVWHNLDFDEDKLFPFLEDLFVIKQDIRFGIYDVLTRVNYPACISPDEPDYRTNYHSIAEKLFYLLDGNVWDRYSRETCLVLDKK